MRCFDVMFSVLSWSMFVMSSGSVSFSLSAHTESHHVLFFLLRLALVV